MILYLWGISFHAVVVFGLGKNLLFKSILGRCVDDGFELYSMDSYILDKPFQIGLFISVLPGMVGNLVLRAHLL